MKTIYLDYSAATPMDESVLRAMHPYFQDQFYNPSASYLSAQKVRHDIQSARELVARTIGARPAEIIFTAGGTEANNLAIDGIMRQYPDHNLVVSAVEHSSVMSKVNTFEATVVPVLPDGRIDLEKLKSSITDKTVLISVMYANNEIGTVMPIKHIAKIIADIREQRRQAGSNVPLYLHTDACQAVHALELAVHKLGVDLMTLNGGKIYGPKQSGILYVKTGVALAPIISGGGQERGLRNGTENVPNIIGFSVALKEIISKQRHLAKDLANMQSTFITALQKQIPNVSINGSLKYRLPNNVHITIPGTDNERIMMELDERGIMCAVGSACSASSDEPSHVLKAIGFSDDHAKSSLRFTFGKHTTVSELINTVQVLSDVLKNYT